MLTELAGGVRLAYVSCNGLEHGDGERLPEERNLMWRRLLEEHGRAPFALLLHGGDQLYADEVSEAHPTLAAWAAEWAADWAASRAASPHGRRGEHRFDAAAERAATRYFVERYLTLYAQPEVAPLLARVPSVMMWDDHDIFDGWGSHDPALLDSAVGRGLFGVARRAFLLFQRGLSPAEEAATASLSYALRFPGFDIVVPDLRSERRPERVVGPAGRALAARHLEAARGVPHVLLMSSVPLLGPRLSLLERLIGVVPRLRRYEDDLRDQWQSRAHRAEWRATLEALERLARAGSEVTVLSGEIHLASRGEMPLAAGRTLHQLIASGVAHPAPSRWWARALGWLATLGEDPLSGRRVTLKGIPGRRGIYTAERNYLVLTRERGAWSAAWECERSGRTPALPLSPTGAVPPTDAAPARASTSGMVSS